MDVLESRTVRSRQIYPDKASITTNRNVRDQKNPALSYLGSSDEAPHRKIPGSPLSPPSLSLPYFPSLPSSSLISISLPSTLGRDGSEGIGGSVHAISNSASVAVAFYPIVGSPIRVSFRRYIWWLFRFILSLVRVRVSFGPTPNTANQTTPPTPAPTPTLTPTGERAKKTKPP